MPRYRDASALAEEIARVVFPHYFDDAKRDKLIALLKKFAAEIKRSAIEP